MNTVRPHSQPARRRARVLATALAVAAAAFVSPARAQEAARAAAPASAPANAPGATPEAPRPKPHEEADGMGQFLLGAGVFDFSEINERLANAGYERFDSVTALIGGEGHAVLRSGFVIGGRGAAILAPSGAGPGELRTHLSGGFGVLDLGFALVDTRSVLCTLTAGIGGYGLSIDIVDERGSSFDAALRDPERGTTLSTGGLLGTLTLGFDGRVPLGEAQEGQRGFFTLGVRAGVLYGPPLGSWSLPEDTDVNHDPSSALLGAVTAVVIGFGGGRER